MGRFAFPTLVYEGNYGAVLVIKSMLEAEGIAVSFDERPPRPHVERHTPSQLYVPREDVERARELIDSGQL